jgi:hypothetical protein
LYVTDDQRLYIGNGSTLGGVQITGYTDEDAQDAAALLFSNGTHTGITFTYNDAANSLSALVDLANYQGTIGATSFRGSVFAEDSTLLVDAVDGVLRGTLVGSVTGNVTGNITGNLTGNSDGFHTGDVKGSVFADDSSIIVDAISNTIFASAVFTSIVDSGNDGLDLKTNSADAVRVIGITDNSIGQIPAITVDASRGLVTNPVNTEAGDLIGAFKVHGYRNGVFEFASGMITQWDATADFTQTFPKSNLLFSLGNNASTQAVSASLSGDGTFVAGVLQTGTYVTTPSDTRPVGAKGMIIFNDTAGVFQGYNGSAWVNLN